MKFARVALALAVATSAAAYYDNQSAPFHLVLKSENKTINGQYLAACHSGAAIESLCLAGVPSPSKPNDIASSTFTFNTSENAVPAIEGNGPPGILTWMLRGFNFNVSSSLELYISPTSNVAMPTIHPGPDGAQELHFDCEDRLNIEGYQDDTKNPPVYEATAYYRWYSCLTNYGGYRYVTLAWVVGPGAPQNPTCVKVEVKRVFV